MARTQARDAIVAEIAALQAKLKAHDKAQAERIGTIALKAGLGGFQVSDDELLKEFEEIAKRFQKPAPTPQSPKPKPAEQPQHAQEAPGERAA